MVHNVLKEVEAQALALATNRTGSEMQELLGFSPRKAVVSSMGLLCTPICALWPVIDVGSTFCKRLCCSCLDC